MKQKQSLWLFRYQTSLDEIMFRVGSGLLGAFFLWLLLDRLFPRQLSFVMGPCLFHLLTDFYCPGCGGTRAVKAMLAGDFVKSLFYHPFVLFASVVGGLFWFSQLLAHGKAYLYRKRMNSHTGEKASENRRLGGMHFYYIYFVIGILLYVVNFLWKNGIVLFLDIQVM